ncbi:MAG: ATP-binding cassette domain-containing protein [Planctomycetes bacterium]|nr:ATP-binding cassette domain-containing protein [Planctomycetota bacterium]
MSGEQPLLHMEGLSKVFYTEEVETHALSNINLSIATGEFVSIAGPSGCGKTTLLSILGLLDSPTSGSRSCARRRSPPANTGHGAAGPRSGRSSPTPADRLRHLGRLRGEPR